MKKRILRTMLIAAFASASLFSTVNVSAQELAEMIPWDNSSLDGWITEESTIPDLKDDFYQAVNAEWISAAEYLPGYASASSFVQLSDHTTSTLMGFMADTSLEGHDAKLLQSFYNLFLDWDTRNELGFSQIIPYVETIEAISSIDELTAYLVSDESKVSGNSLIPISGASADPEDPHVYCLSIGNLNLSMRDSAEYETQTQVGQLYLYSHQEISKIALDKLGYSEDRITEILENCYAFENMISSAIPTTAEQALPSYAQTAINKVTFEELKEMSPTYPLTEIMEARNMSDWNRINVTTPKFIEKLNEVYTEENLTLIKDFLICNIAKGFAPLTDQDTFYAINEVQRTVSGTTLVSSDEFYAYSYTASYLPISLDKIFAEQCLTPEIREDITSICEAIIDSYREMLAEEEWMSEETRAKAIEKLDNITINAVYPDKWSETDSLNIVPAEDGGTLWDAVLAVREYNNSYNESVKNANVDKELWETAITKHDRKLIDANAVYSPENNAIFIIGGLVGEPFYSADMSEEEKLARIGSAIGHEISHAFDTSGAQYDKDGYFCNWWTDEDYAKFTERAQKLIDYFDKMVVFPAGIQYSGAMVQTEAIADMGSLKCMLHTAKSIEDFDYDQFFKAYAELWRSKETPQQVMKQILTDTHPLNYLRVNVGLQQFDEFVETYNIEPGDGMYLAKEDSILVW